MKRIWMWGGESVKNTVGAGSSVSIGTGARDVEQVSSTWSERKVKVKVK